MNEIALQPSNSSIPNSSLPSNDCRYSVSEHMNNGYVHIIFAYLVPIFALVGLVGNALTIITLNWGTERGRKNTSLFLSSKAVADFGASMFTILFNLNAYENMIDSDEYSRFYYHHLFKPVIALANWHLMASTWYAVTVTFERMFAICWPLKARHALTTRRISICIILIALISLLLTIYPLLALTPATHVDCKRRWRHVYGMRGPLSQTNPGLWHYLVSSRFLHNILATVVPVVLLLFFNVAIVWHLRIHAQSLVRFTDAGYSQKDAGEQVRISVIVFTITAATAIFLLPSAAVLLYDFFGRSVERKPTSYQAFVHASNVLVLCDKVLDFFLYCLISSNFRKRLRAVMNWRRWMEDRRRSSASRTLDTGYAVVSTFDEGRKVSKETIKSRPSMPL